MPRPAHPALGETTHSDDTAQRSPAPRGLRLLVLHQGSVATHALPARGRVTLGRSRSSDVVIPHSTVSRAHAVLRVEPHERVTVEDVPGSTSGVRVRKQPIAPGRPYALASGDSFELGDVLCVLEGSATKRSVVASPNGPVVCDPKSVALYDLAARVGRGDIHVLVTGETGSGKELVAEAVHRSSARAAGPFVKLNCAAIAPTLVESELFGHEKGAFTGAHATRPGLLESAHRGTVFLDEVGELSIELQAKLLRVVEDGAVLRVGARAPRSVDLRVVSATHRDLRELVQAGRFRADLMFRLQGVRVDVPPLRERPGDLAPLVEHFLARHGRGGDALTPRALAALRAYRWPGNVRELRNVLEHGALLAGSGAIDVEHLPRDVAEPSEAPPAERAPGTGAVRGELQALERARILEALEATGDNRTRAAERLGIPRRTLTKRLAVYGLTRKRTARDRAEAPALDESDGGET